MEHWNASILVTNFLRVSTNRLRLISVASLLFCLSTSNLQAQLKSGVHLSFVDHLDKPSIFSKLTKKQDILPIRERNKISKSIRSLPNHTPKHYGYFCKLESKIEAKSKIPLRFRLGSLDYVNYLEQKFNPSPSQVKYY